MSGRGFDGRVSIVCNLVEEDIILKGWVGLCMELSIFGEEYFQANSDSILMWKYGREGCNNVGTQSHRGRNNETKIYKEKKAWMNYETMGTDTLS